jgi:hypothetical protein
MPIYAKFPDGKKLMSIATSDLNINVFNPRARSAHIINGLATHSLLSCGQMCDTGYRVVFDKDKARIIDGDVMVNRTVVMEGQRDQTTGLWTVQLDNKIQQVGSEYQKRSDEITKNVYEIRKVYDIIQYLHTDTGSPVPSMFIKAIEAGNFMTWPTLTAQHVNTYLVKSEATIKGHMNQTRKNFAEHMPGGKANQTTHIGNV